MTHGSNQETVPPAVNGAMPGGEAGEPSPAPRSTAPSKVASAAKTRVGEMASVLGRIVLIMMQSPQAKHRFLTDLESCVLPAITLGQCRVFERNGQPVAYALWAFVSEEVEKRLEQGMMQLKPSDWKCGDRPWLVELGAIPAVAADEKAIGALLSGLARTVFPLTGYRAIWSNAKTGKREVISVGLREDEPVNLAIG